MPVTKLFAHTDLSVAATVEGPTKLDATISANTLSSFGGLGLRYAFNGSWHLKVEFDHYDARRSVSDVPQWR